MARIQKEKEDMSTVHTMIQLYNRGFSFSEILKQADYTAEEVCEAKAIIRAKQLSRQQMSTQHSQASYAMRLKSH